MAALQIIPKDWSSLPTDVLELVSKRLESCVDYVRFRSVSTAWRSAAPKRRHVPLLLVRLPHSVSSRTLKLCNFPNMEFYNPARLPEVIPRATLIRGSSRGWVGFYEGASDIFSLHNPFTGLQIHLPNLCYTHKFILSHDPALDPDNCVVMALYPDRLVFCRLGDSSWTMAATGTKYADSKSFVDSIFYKGKFYVVSINFGVFVCQVDSSASSFVEIPAAVPKFSGSPTLHWHLPAGTDVEVEDMPIDLRGDSYSNPSNHTNRYLVESSGDLLVVALTYNYNFKSCGCEVFRVDIDGGQLGLFNMENLGGRTLFLDRQSSSISLSVDDSSPTWCTKNCIYYVGIQSQIIVFNMQERSISYMTDQANHLMDMHWLTPSLY